MTAVVTSTTPLVVTTESGMSILASDLYVTDNCIGLLLNLTHDHKHEDTEKDGQPPTEKTSDPALRNQVVLRRGLAVGDGVLLLCRPDSIDGVKYILLDRIQPYIGARVVSAV